MSDEMDVYPNTLLDWRSNRCGHNYQAAECKEKHCLARDLIIIRAELKAENERLRAELRERCEYIAGGEWGAYDETDNTPYCPECLNQKWQGHAPNCRHARLMQMPEEPTP